MQKGNRHRPSTGKSKRSNLVGPAEDLEVILCDGAHSMHPTVRRIRGRSNSSTLGFLLVGPTFIHFLVTVIEIEI